MPDIYLRSVPSDANANDVRLYDPTAASGTTNYTLICSTGVYSYVGNDVVLTVNRNLSCAAGAYTYTGVNVSSLKLARQLICNPGTYAYTGNSATFIFARGVVCSAGSYSYTSGDASFVYSPGTVGTSYTLSCDNGVYAYSGTDATLTKTTVSSAHSGYWREFYSQLQEEALKEYDRKKGLPANKTLESGEQITKKTKTAKSPTKLEIDVADNYTLPEFKRKSRVQVITYGKSVAEKILDIPVLPSPIFSIKTYNNVHQIESARIKRQQHFRRRAAAFLLLAA